MANRILTKYLHSVVALMVVVHLSGCAMSGSGGAGDTRATQATTNTGTITDYVRSPDLQTGHEEIIAVDLVSVMMQLSQFSPFQTTVQVTRPDNSFGQTLLNTLATSGYGVQRVDFDQGANFVTYRIRYTDASRGLMSATLLLNELSISRQYQLLDGDLYPYTEFVIRGAEPQNILVNSQLFRSREQSRDLPSAVHFADYEGDRPTYYSTLAKTPIDPALSNQIDVARELVKSQAALFTLSRIESADSTSDQTSRMDTVQVLKVRFQGQDMTLGPENKRAIRTLLTEFDSANDYLVIAGCAHGQSLLWDGTESASLERQQRITKELLAHGIRLDRVQEQGCFQSDHVTELLPKMVIIAHKKPTQPVRQLARSLAQPQSRPPRAVKTQGQFL